MDWLILSDLYQVEQIVEQSFTKPVVVFKHSTRCSISHMTKGRLEREVQPQGIDFYYLDLLTHRLISNTLSAKFSVHHESPQVLLIRNGECVYDESHSAINMDEIRDQAFQTS